MHGSSAGRTTPAQVATEEDLRGYLQALMTARTNIRAVAAETGLSKTTVNELRMGRRRVSLDALTKVVGAYAPNEVAAARQAWHRVQPPRRPRAAAVSAVASPVTPPRPGDDASGDGQGHAEPAGSVASEGATPTAANPSAEAVTGASAGGVAPASPPATAFVAAADGGSRHSVDPRKTETDAGPVGRSRWLPVGTWPRTLYAVLVVLALVAMADGVRAVVDRWHADSPSKPAVATGPCISPAQDISARLTPHPSQDAAPTRLRAVAYHLQRSDPPRLEIAAALSDPVPGGSVVQMLERADPNTVDSTPEHHPGNGRYYPRPEIRSVGQCVFVPQGQIGYGGFAGIRVRYTVVLLPARFSRTIVADSNAGDGLSDQDLTRYSLTRLASFEFRV